MRQSEEQLQKSYEAKRSAKHEDFPEIYLRLQEDIDSRTGSIKYPTGIRELDELTFGVHKKELLVIGARPSHAKTSLALSMCWNLAKNKIPTIFVSLEMSKEAIAERIICQEYKINGWKLRKGENKEREQFTKAMPEFYKQLPSIPFQVIDYMGRSVGEIRYILDFYKPEVLCLDYIQKISQSGFGSRYEALSDFVQSIQDLAIEKNCAIILVSQINRSGEFAKGSGEIEETADCFIRTKWLCKEEPEYMDKQEYQIQIEKQRHGPCDFRLVNFDAATFTFSSRDFS